MAEALRAEALGVRLGSRQLVEAVSFAAERGSLFAISGPNGAGKTSLLKALLGLLPYSGAVRIAGSELGALGPAERARALAYVPQRSQLASSMAVREVVAQARYAHRSRFGRIAVDDPAVARALKQTGLEGLAGRSFDRLSGGEQRRVLFARALASEARVLLLDEPTSGLDVAQVLYFFRLARQLTASGYTLLCVLHELGDALRHADAALLLHGGRAIAWGPVADALSAANIARVYGVHAHERAALGFSLDGNWR